MELCVVAINCRAEGEGQTDRHWQSISLSSKCLVRHAQHYEVFEFLDSNAVLFPCQKSIRPEEDGREALSVSAFPFVSCPFSFYGKGFV